MQIYARQDAKQCSEPEVPLLFSPFFEAALNHCKSALASAPLYAAPATADAKPPLARRPAGPPALPSHTEAAEPPPCPPGGCCVPSTLLRLAALAGPHLPAARQGHVPPSLPAGQRTPVFLARVRPGKGAPLGRERKPCVPVQPTHRRPRARSRGKPLPGPQPSPPARAPCLSRQSPSQEPLCQRAPPHQHHHPVRAGPRERGPPERSSRAHTPWGRDPAVAERNVGARPQRPRGACACT